MSDPPKGFTVDETPANLPPGFTVDAPDEVAPAPSDLMAFPRGIIKGLSTAASLGGQAAQIEMGQEVDVPAPEEEFGLIQKHVTGELPKPASRFGRVLERGGEIAGSPATWILGPEGALLKGALIAPQAAGMEFGGEAARAVGAPEGAGEFIGGVLGGAAGGAAAASRAAGRLPTLQQIKDSATAAYDAVKNSRLRVSQPAVDQLTADARTALDNDLIVESVAPRTFKALEKLQTGGGDVAQIMGIRQKLGDIPPSASTDYTAALQVKDHIDSFIEGLGPQNVIAGDPQFTAAMLDHARSSWRAYKKLDQIQTAREVGAHRAAVSGTGANVQNAMRQRVREILDSDKKSRGFSEATKQQMEKIVEGTWASNAARYAGKFAPSGPVSAIGALATGYGAGAEAGAAVAVGATLAKYLGTYLTKRQLTELENMIRAESPIGAAAAKAAPVGGAGTAAARAALTAGPLSMQSE